jgi:hypothetical protein
LSAGLSGDNLWLNGLHCDELQPPEDHCVTNHGRNRLKQEFAPKKLTDKGNSPVVSAVLSKTVSGAVADFPGPFCRGKTHEDHENDPENAPGVQAPGVPWLCRESASHRTHDERHGHVSMS